MRCNGCGNEKAYKTFAYKDVEFCDRCGSFSSDALPDVYWDGTPEHGLADDPVTGKPRVFGSKLEKAAYLKSRGLVEGWNQKSSENKQDSMESVKKALSEVSKWGKEYRRQEFNRIKKSTECFT